MRRIQKNNNVMELFDSISDFLTDTDARPYVYDEPWCTYHRGDNQHYDKEWCSYATYAEAAHDIKTGLARQVKALQVKPQTTDNANTPRPYMDVVGYAVDVPAALMGLPECMHNVNMQTNNIPVVTLFIDCARRCDTSTREIAEYGRRVIGYIKALELQGIRVTAYCLECMGKQNERAILALKVKDAAASLDIKRLTFPLMSAGMLRVLGFDWYERTALPVEHYSGYGREVLRGETSTPEFIKQCAPDSIYINHYTDFDTLDITTPAR